MTDRAAAPAPVPPLLGADPADQLAHLRLALEAADTGLWTWDPHTDAVAWSDQTYRIHRLQPHEFDNTGAGFFALVFSEDRERVSATVRAAIAARTLYECEFRIVRPGGELLWVANRGRAVYGADGAPLRMLGTLTDISQRRHAEEAQARSAAFARSVDIVLLDIGLPGMDGYEVARRLRADAALRGTLLVALTGWGSEADKRRSAEAGFDAYLTKPVALGDVEAVLARVPASGQDSGSGEAPQDVVAAK